MKILLLWLVLAASVPSFAADTGDLYEKKEKTLLDVMKAFRDSAMEAPIIAAGVQFLSASGAGGSCPQWTVNPSLLQVTINLGQFFCSPAVSGALSVVGWGVLAGALYLAFRVAFL